MFKCSELTIRSFSLVHPNTLLQSCRYLKGLEIIINVLRSYLLADYIVGRWGCLYNLSDVNVAQDSHVLS
jgi:hypothetical protein